MKKLEKNCHLAGMMLLGRAFFILFQLVKLNSRVVYCAKMSSDLVVVYTF